LVRNFTYTHGNLLSRTNLSCRIGSVYLLNIWDRIFFSVASLPNTFLRLTNFFLIAIFLCTVVHTVVGQPEIVVLFQENESLHATD